MGAISWNDAWPDSLPQPPPLEETKEIHPVPQQAKEESKPVSAAVTTAASPMVNDAVLLLEEMRRDFSNRLMLFCTITFLMLLCMMHHIECLRSEVRRLAQPRGS
mgnify:CR=1 FL=1